ncbi:glyoxalase/bleomycin resistance protein/dioxygenase superfamily protein [Amycolatopsis sulphurea]|uniref:Glyoxalase/bleomycin resistance protein/dioxygenase superfamily protein n=1 Tax=Amycolatopsis sulphurea TaxID=76022 RepID=A0A2A9FF85_9PSEU|nr:VOC family protein [Amycolatopsis sulphurea]PFG49232.1 glyoxalase/bleomycin resistance protein/dioxygenase superfamily protein [Amycolatopsis sulphurea]
MSKINYAGLKNLALDRDATARFYREALGIPLVGTTGNRDENYPHRHYYFPSPGRGGSIAFSRSARGLDLEPWFDDADPVPAAREQV